MKILLATANKNKLKEINEILDNTDCGFLSLDEEFKKIQIEENGNSYLENALIKASTLYSHTRIPSLADDSGLEIKFLDGKPGLHSARFLGSAGFHEKSLKILELLKDVPFHKRKARFVCSACLYTSGEVFLTTGILEGYIGYEYQGKYGFGYDPIFYLPNYKKTLAELAPEEKNKISHRAIAFQKMKKYL